MIEDRHEEPIAAEAEVPEEFVAQLRDALSHLYDYAHLQRHPLARLATPGEAGVDRAKALRNLLLDTLEQLNPGDGVSRNEREWRAYGIMVRRYVDGFAIEDICDELHVSLRQFQREHRKGLLAAASMLWNRHPPAQPPPEAAPADGGSLQQEVERLGVILERVDLNGLVASALESLQALADGRGVHLRLRLPDGAVWAWADRTLAKQALLGTLTPLIAARPAHLAIRCQATAEAARLEVEIHPPLAGDDTPGGDGERFRAAAELMQAQSGHLAPATGGRGLTAVELRFRRARGAHVLVVDDNERVQQLFERYLTAEGYHVSAAGDAEQALALAREAAPDAIVLDVMMRHLDGWQLLQRLRADPDLQGVPIVVCSVLNEPDLAAALGARGYLKKPVTQQQMLAAVKAALAGSSPAAPPPAAP